MSRYGDDRPAGRYRRSGQRPLWHKILAWTSGVLVAVLVAASLAVYLKERALWDSIQKVAITDLGHRPPKYSNAENILVFGSDSRQGLTRHAQIVLHVGPTGCGCSDTIMVVHVEPDHKGVTVLNLPRDTEVPIYQCNAGPGESGQTPQPGQVELINSTLQHGGPSCLWKTVEQVTGIHLDHFIQLSFTGVVKVINDIGGVNVCVPFNINDPMSGLHIRKGERHINGIKFLEYWRARYSLANGTDLARIKRDDLLLAEVFRAIVHEGLLSNFSKLSQIVTDAAKSVRVDAGMTQSDMLSLAESFRGLTANELQFIEAPTVPYPGTEQVEFTSADKPLFYAIAHNTSVKRAERRAARAARSAHGKTSSKSGSGTTPVLDASPASVKVQVLNGSGVNQIAATVDSALTARGFDVTGTGDAPNFSYTDSVIEYASSADLGAVNTLKAQLSHVKVVRDPSVTPGTLVLVVGSRYHGLRAASKSGQSTTSVAGLAKSYGGITGSATCKTDKSAFDGPNSP